MLLHILQCTGQGPTVKNYLAPDVNSAEVRNPERKSTFSFCKMEKLRPWTKGKLLIRFQGSRSFFFPSTRFLIAPSFLPLPT